MAFIPNANYVITYPEIVFAVKQIDTEEGHFTIGHRFTVLKKYNGVYLLQDQEGNISITTQSFVSNIDPRYIP